MPAPLPLPLTSGVHIMPQWLTDLSLTEGGALIGALIAAGVVLRKLYVLVGNIKDRADDLFGEKARPGVPARPGVMEHIAALTEQLTLVVHEVHPNGGGSMRDSVSRIERMVSTDVERLDDHETYADGVIRDHTSRLDGHDHRLDAHEARIQALEAKEA